MLTNIYELGDKFPRAVVNGEVVDSFPLSRLPIADCGLRRALTLLGRVDDSIQFFEVTLPENDAVTFLALLRKLGCPVGLQADADGSSWCWIEGSASASAIRPLIDAAYGFGAEQVPSGLYPSDWWARPAT